jgi:hypothetical protein
MDEMESFLSLDIPAMKKEDYEDCSIQMVQIQPSLTNVVPKVLTMAMIDNVFQLRIINH